MAQPLLRLQPLQEGGATKCAEASVRQGARCPDIPAAPEPGRDSAPGNVLRLEVDPDAVHGFREQFFANVQSDREFLWNALEDPVFTEEVLRKCYCRVVRWLPEHVLDALLRFFLDPGLEPAICISGLPLDEDIPPTPRLPGDFRLPVCEAWLLGVGRILGIPHGMLGFYTTNARGGLVRDLVPKPGLGGINNPFCELGFHRDVPADVSGASMEPEGFMLLAARGDPSHQAKTLVCSNRNIASALTARELHVLRENAVRTECVRVASGVVTPYGQPFHAVGGPETDPKVTLFYIPEHRDFFHRVVSDDAETQAAYDRATRLARERCTAVDLQAGDLLLINNARCNHARTAFEPRLDGTDRWLLKTFVCGAGWRRPSQMQGGSSPLAWPQLLMEQ